MYQWTTADEEREGTIKVPDVILAVEDAWMVGKVAGRDAKFDGYALALANNEIR